MEDLDFTTKEGEQTQAPTNPAVLPDELDFSTPPADESQEEPVTPSTDEPSTPSAEAPVTPSTDEPVTPNTDEPSTPSAEAPVTPTETTVEINDELITSYLSTKYGKTITSDDLAGLTKEVEQEDPYVAKLKEWREKTGRPIEDWVKYTKDVESMDVESILREKIKNDFPSLTDEQIEQELDSYMILEDDDEDTQRNKELRLAKELPSIKEELKKNALSFGEPIDNLPTQFKENYDTALSIIDQNKAIQAQQQQDSELVLESIKTLDSVKLDLDGTKQIDFKLDNGSRESILKYVEKPETWVNPDGSFNASQMLRDAAIVNNFDAIVKSVYQQGIDEGLLRTVQGTANAVEPNIVNSDVQTTKSSVVIEGYDEMMGRHRGFGFKKK